MASFVIKDEELTGLKGKVVIVTGGSSGIGLATVDLLLSLGASVVNGDIQPPAEKTDSSASALTFVRTNVAIWAELIVLFKKTKDLHGRVDHVFANAGVAPRADYLSTEADANGDLKEPTHELLDISLKGVMNTATLAIYYMRAQPGGGSIVITSSSIGIQRFRAVDYATAKHAVLGFGRGLVALIDVAKLPIRVNTLAPSWTESNVLPNMKGSMDKIGVKIQPPLAVARAATIAMADASRNGHVIHVQCGKYQEIDEAVLLPAYEAIRGKDYPSEDDVMERLYGGSAGGQA
ncbi:short-chain dehydrogenase [Xylariales sp. AK1849]|nr:short-chain dehydrogenase [Xylariales sp. AK1849]